MTLSEDFTLANGVRIPKLGLGTWRISDSDVEGVVREAAKLGYRHFDTAQAYANERGVGQGLRSSGIPRDQFFITTKLAAECKTYREAKTLIDGSLKTLGFDHIDLMLIHSPQPWAEFREGGRFFEGNLEAWRALEEAHTAGKLRAIGVSNFERADLDNLLANGSIKPLVNQVLAHIGATPFDLIEYANSKGILVEAYSPVAHGALMADKRIAAMADAYGVSVAQLGIRYCLQLGILPLPKTANFDHLRTNAALDFEISDADMETLKSSQGGTDYGAASAFPVFGKKREVADAAQD